MLEMKCNFYSCETEVFMTWDLGFATKYFAIKNKIKKDSSWTEVMKIHKFIPLLILLFWIVDDFKIRF